MMPPTDTVLVIGDEDGRTLDESVARTLRAAGLSVHRADASSGPDVLQAWMANDKPPPAVLLAPDLETPLQVARRVHTAAPLVQIVFLVGADRARRLHREMTLAPMIGNHWTIADPDAANLPRVLESAVRSTRQRSSLRTTLDRMNLRIAEQPPAEGETYRRLVVSDHHLAAILEHAEDAILSIDRNDDIATWNRGAGLLFGHERSDALGRPIDVLVPSTQAGALRSLVHKARVGRPVVRHELPCRRADGSDFEAEFSLAPVRDDAGRIVAVSAIIRDVTDRKRNEERIRTLNAELERRVRDMNQANLALKNALEMLEAKKQELLTLNEELERRATTDALTGLKNRIVFQNSLLEMIAVAARQSTPLSVLIVDVDHFKRVNDTWGHQEGDRVLQAVAEVLNQHTRDQDIVARYGGEEFAVLLPNTGPDAALAVAENLRVGCRNAIELEPALTISVGAATFRTGDSDVSLIGRADEALYAAKAQGRDRVAHADVPR